MNHSFFPFDLSCRGGGDVTSVASASGAKKGRDRMSSVSNLHLSGVDPALKIIIFVLMVAHVAALVRASASRRGSGCARAHVRNQASPPCALIQRMADCNCSLHACTPRCFGSARLCSRRNSKKADQKTTARQILLACLTPVLRKRDKSTHVTSLNFALFNLFHTRTG